MFGRKKKPKNQDGHLKATYELAGRAAHTAATPLMKMYLTPKHIRVRVLVMNEEKEILLVRSWFGHQKWSLPGGGIGRTETPIEAAVREVYEETGLRIGVDDLEELGTFQNPNPKHHYTVACFKLIIPKRLPHIAKRHRVEMLDAAWHPTTHLPAERSAMVDVALSLLG